MRVEDRKFTSLVSPYDVRDYKFACVSEVVLPETFDCTASELASVKLSVKDQGSTGSCVAHACSSVIEFHNKRQKATGTIFSTEFIYGYRPLGYYVGEGMYLRDALKTIQKIGDVPLTTLRGNHECDEAMEAVEAKLEEYKDIAYPHRVSTYMRVNSEQDIKQALMKYGPVLVSMPWAANYKLKNGVYTVEGTATRGNHCVFIYGWDERGWLVHNSWGAGWGQKGKFVVPFDFKWNEAWSITDSIVEDDDVVRPEEKWYVRVFYKIINFFKNLFKKK
jgi:hypothetical protein